MEIQCKIPHDGYYPSKTDNPGKADLRVSDNFEFKNFTGDKLIKISCPNQEIEFRIREDHRGTTDNDAYDGEYFSDGDFIEKSNYEKLYISNPRNKNTKCFCNHTG